MEQSEAADDDHYCTWCHSNRKVCHDCANLRRLMKRVKELREIDLEENHLDIPRDPGQGDG